MRKDISELTGVTLRFALKILRKLTQSGITKSYKGVAGGHELNRSSEISLGEIIECIDDRSQSTIASPTNFSAPMWEVRMNATFTACSRRSTGLCGSLFAITMDRFLPAKLLQNK